MKSPKPDRFSPNFKRDPKPSGSAASRLLKAAAALDKIPDARIREAGMTEVRRQAKQAGVALISLNIVTGPLPNPLIDNLPQSERRRIEAVSRAMYSDPGAQLEELTALVAKYPGIPMLRNHLGQALDARGKSAQSMQIMEETVRLFPDYIIGFTNYVLLLLSAGKVEQARQLVETGERGPLLHLGEFAPGRDTFHIAEAMSYAMMTGLYFLATDRPDDAKVSHQLFQSLAPGHPQEKILKRRIEEHNADPLGKAAKLLLKLAKHPPRRTKKRKDGQ
ncbi:MAG: hypothetical protein JNM86_06895 [Phycisphaerae bacterium]|nr:hypothetical protein [Phycisphaerae bacterium]